MSLLGSFASRFARPAGKALDAPIREIVHEVLREHGYASPAEVQALRDELRDLLSRVDGLDRKVGELAAVADRARAEAAAARAEAARVLPEDPRLAALQARVAELEAARTSAPAQAPAPEPAPAPEEPAVARPDCKVPDCAEAVRSKGFCSAHYQQWRRGTLKGFVTAEATVLVGDRVIQLPKDTIAAAVHVEGNTVYVDGRAIPQA